MEPQEVSRYCFHLNSVANRRVAGALHNRYSCTSLVPKIFLSEKAWERGCSYTFTHALTVRTKTITMHD